MASERCSECWKDVSDKAKTILLAAAIRVLQLGPTFVARLLFASTELAICVLCIFSISGCDGSSEIPDHPDGAQPQTPPPVSSPCSTVRCPANSTCLVSGNTAQCACNQGYVVVGQECLADLDEDGLADRQEAVFAASVAPILAFSAQEGFRDRFSYWAVRRNGNRISVFYALAYVQDGGDPLLGLEAHKGDSEFIVLDFVSDGSGGTTFDRAFLSAHYGVSLTDQSTWYRQELSFRQDSLGPHAIIWVGENKHANYPDPVTCEAGGLGFDTCDAGSAEFVEVLPDRHLGNSRKPLIDMVAHAGGVDYFWSDQPFCGWQVPVTGSRVDCVPPANSYARELWAWEQGAL